MSSYDPQAIEKRWQAYWEAHGTFRTPNPGDENFDPQQPKFYVLAMFPYPSGAGMHMGHALNYTSTDIVARYKKHRGFNVLHPIGYDAFGLPAEQYAVEHGVHPAITTQQNIDTIGHQLRRLGLSFDWDRCISTTDVEYYKWTQWIFLQLYHSYFDPVERKAKPIPHGHEDRFEDRRLAYIAEVPVNWCPALGTVLANEEVTNEGRSERGNHPVYKRPLRQWMLRITSYADRLLEDLSLVDWPEPMKLMQRNWIGRSEGAIVKFEISDLKSAIIEVFTTRPDTLFGATYMVLAPEHPLVEKITTDSQRQAVREYQGQAAARADVDRMAEGRQKTGVFTGAYAINPVILSEADELWPGQRRLPIWIADYVLMGYGTGAIMAVPSHDERDMEFALKYEIPTQNVVMPPDGWLRENGRGWLLDKPIEELRETYSVTNAYFRQKAFTGEGVSINSWNEEISINGLPTAEAKKKITHWLESKGLGKAQVQYKLRDWLFSRQRYWGEPFPILHGPRGEIVPVHERDLPVELPRMEDFTPEASDDPNAPPRPPLARAPETWRLVQRNGDVYERELNTMPQWAGSCWYYLRFLDAGNDERFVGADVEQYWMGRRGVDLYIGGVEHAVLHLLYARFWHKVLFDLDHVSTPEPFGRLFNQGYVQAAAYTDRRGVYVPAEQVEQRDGAYYFRGEPVTRQFGKMGKSLKNSVSPDSVCDEYGADTLRLYLMYMGPLDASKPWEARDMVGLSRFLKRVWRNFVDEESGALRVTAEAPSEQQLRLLHKTIGRVTDDMERLAFNTAIAALIELNNELVGSPSLPRAIAEPMLIMLSPLAPHIAEELWSRLGHEESIADEPWPAADPRYVADDAVEMVVQVMGKVRGRITVPINADETSVQAAALADSNVVAHLAGKTVRKVVVVPGKLVNIVAN